MVKIRSCIEKMTGYIPGEPAKDNQSIKLNQNENRYAPSSKVAEAIRNEVARLPLYPESTSYAVKKAASEVYGTDMNRVMVTNGSDEMLRLLFQLFCDPGDETAAFYPSYTYYSTLAAMHDVRYRFVDFTDSISIPEQLGFTGTKLVFLPNPNAPTGTLFSHSEIRRLAEAVPNGMVVVDEAYVDFAPEGSTAIPLIDELDNIVVVRTFSKSYSLAGLRIGLGFARKETLEEMEKIRDYYNLDRLAQAGAEAALRDRQWLVSTTDKIIATREKTVAEVLGMGLRVYPSSANFILIDFGSPATAETIFRGLRDKNILVRYFRNRRVDSCLRVSIGTDDDMTHFLSALKDCMKEFDR